ncbi:MAG: hypothetical protein MUE36_15485 [Acidimicrobiales bacterium]|jgi:hypothetical protein|nr:hypothetical protein [Acidimicrobiales bacterium]
MVEEPSATSAAEAGSEPPTVDEHQPLSPGRRLGRVMAVAVFVFIAGLWAYALWGPVQRVPQGRLDSLAFAEAAEPVCAATMARIDALPPAFETRDAATRAAVVASANDELAVMLGELEAIAPSPMAGDDGRMIDEWLGDWRIYLGDRERYAVALASDPDARMLVTEKERRQVSEPIDYFADTNFMPNCATAGDLA